MKSVGLFLENQVSGEKTFLQEVKSEASIGTARTADVQLDDLRCGGIHALIERVEGKDEFIVIDLGSRSGTYLKGKRISEAKITSGDKITIGQHHLILKSLKPGAKPTPRQAKARPKAVKRRFKPISDASAVPDVNDKTILQVALFWGEQILDIRTFVPGTEVTLGPQKDATFGVTLATKKLQDNPYTIASYSSENLKLHIPGEAAGLVWVGEDTISLDSLRHEDKTRNTGDLTVPLKIGDRADIHFGELTLSFRFVTPAVEPPKKMFFYLDRVFLRVLGMLALIYIAFFSWLFYGPASNPRVVTFKSLPKHMKKVIFNVGIEKALKRQQAAIGQLAQQLEGGRARAEEGKSQAKKDARKDKQKSKTKNQKRNKKVAKASSKSPNNPSAAEPTVDVNSIFSSKRKSATKTPKNLTGSPQDGATASALAGKGFARGNSGIGPGGGGRSVGIGSLTGSRLGGGLGAGRYGLSPSKGREINIPEDEELQILGGLDPEIIAKYIKRYLNQIRDCYEQQLQHRPSLAGKVRVQFVIGGSGGVKSAKIIESGLADPPTHSCIIGKINKWKFPKPVGGTNVGVKYPFILQSNR